VGVVSSVVAAISNLIASASASVGTSAVGCPVNVVVSAAVSMVFVPITSAGTLPCSIRSLMSFTVLLKRSGLTWTSFEVRVGSGPFSLNPATVVL